ncbi:MAG: hypothetical protein HY327_02665 [Chloroflexi bacterium]|nr:hypothetical protein [Chloroflexota bacterium]
MIDYLKPGEFVLQRVWFDYLGGRYQGRGLLTWKPESGFHLGAFLERSGAPLPKRIEIGRAGIIPPSEFVTIRMKPLGDNWAIAPNALLHDSLELIDQQRLSIGLGRVIFSSRMEKDSAFPNWSGSALYKIEGGPLLPDSVHTETRINDKKIAERYSMAGIVYEDAPKTSVIGRMTDDNHLELHWSLSALHYDRSFAWRWPQAAQNALSMLIGETVELLQRQLFRGAQMLEEMNKPRGVHSLGLFRLFDQDFLNKDVFIRLSEFLAREEPNARICRAIFEQMAEAARQKTLQGNEFLISTVVDAALRTIDREPFRAGEYDTWDINKSVNQFRQNFLSDKWSNACEKVLQARKRLRHRNAHPDWLYTERGALSDEQLAISLDDRIFLSRFCGYMILALAGFKDLEPVFPKPHKEWVAPLVRTQI